MKENKMRWMGILISFLMIGAIVAFSGCISEKEEPDEDGDGVPDSEDQYPGEDDKLYNDDDGDGVINKEDQYPDRNDTMFGGTFVRWSSEPSTLDPVMSTDQASHEILEKLFDGLVQFRAGTTEIEPGLAKSWDVNPSGTEYTFYLRDGVKFHNGRNMTADDVKYSIDRLMDNETASPRINFAEDIESMEVVNATVIKITTKYAFVPFLAKLAYTCFMIVPEEEVVKHGDDWFKNPVGTGPFKFVKWDAGSLIEVEANDDYWGGRPYIDTYAYYVHEDDEVIWQGILAGEVSLGGVPSTHWEEYLADDEMVKYSKTTAQLVTYFLYFNCGKWPFNKKEIRNAVSYAFQRDEILDTIFKGRHLPAHGPLPPALWGFDQDLYDDYEYTYNPTKANALLDQANIVDTDGDGIREYEGQPLIIEYSSYVSSTWQTASETHLANLRAIGMDATYVQYDFPTLLGKMDEGNYTLMTLGWGTDYPDPENFMILWETKNIPDPNGAFYSNPTYDDLADQAKKEVDVAKRLDLYKQLQAILMEDNPQWWFFHPRITNVWQPWINGVQIGGQSFSNEKCLGLWIDPDHQ
jgi:peptide/nickel transport system substrate-binding protein